MPKYKLNRERPVSLSTVQLLGVPFGWHHSGVSRLIAVYRFVHTPDGLQLQRSWQQGAYVSEEDKYRWSMEAVDTLVSMEAISRVRQIYLAEEIKDDEPQSSQG